MNDNVSSTMWATILNEKLAGVASGYPPHELAPNQFPLTPLEFTFLESIFVHKIDLAKATKLIRGIQLKIRRLEKCSTKKI